VTVDKIKEGPERATSYAKASVFMELSKLMAARERGKEAQGRVTDAVSQRFRASGRHSVCLKPRGEDKQGGGFIDSKSSVKRRFNGLVSN